MARFKLDSKSHRFVVVSRRCRSGIGQSRCGFACILVTLLPVCALGDHEPKSSGGSEITHLALDRAVEYDLGLELDWSEMEHLTHLALRTCFQFIEPDTLRDGTLWVNQ